MSSLEEGKDKTQYKIHVHILSSLHSEPCFFMPGSEKWDRLSPDQPLT